MNYTVTYLAAGERRSECVESLDAARAVAIVEESQRRSAGSFELLSVLRIDRGRSPRPAGEATRAPA